MIRTLPDLVNDLFPVRFFGVADASKIVECHPSTIYRHIRQGTLSAEKFKGCYWISEDDLKFFKLYRLDNPGLSPL